MPKNPNIKKVLVIGSGPIVIGQAAEFDYAGTQACRSLKEEGIEVVLVNSNPATINEKTISLYFAPLPDTDSGSLQKQDRRTSHRQFRAHGRRLDGHRSAPHLSLLLGRCRAQQRTCPRTVSCRRGISAE